MKIRLLLVCGALFAGRCALGAAEDPKAPPPPVADALKALVGQTRAKLAAGARTPAALADELKAFDALLAAHAGEKTDAVAQVALMKAALYLQVFGDYEKGIELLQKLTADFPGTPVAGTAKDLLAKLDQQKESLKRQAALKPGAVFPDFNEKDLAGAPLSIGRYQGKVVLVDFWATWCGPCVAELPHVLAAYQKYHAKGFEIVGISLDQSEDALKTFIKARGMTWAQYFDGKGWGSKLGKAYGVTSIPATYLLDGDGRIVAKDLRGPALDAELARLLKE